jgi:4'-phosphopantetheinyl transferase
MSVSSGATAPRATIDCHRLDLSSCAPDDLAVLDPAERARAGRFKFERDRIRYIAAHARMRRHLAAVLGVSATQVPLAATGNGKPVFDADAAPVARAAAAGRPLCFNLSHSGAVGYLVIAPFSVGVDVELDRPLDDLQPLIDSYCSPGEVAALAALPSAQRRSGFLGVWTRKEAVLKAWGTGIGAIPLDALHVGIDTEAVPPLHWSHEERYPGLRLKSLASEGQVLSIAGDTDQPLTVRLVPQG